MGLFKAPGFTTRVPVQFISDDAPSLSITTTQNVLQNNPSALKIVTGTSAKIDPDISGINNFRGAGELAPTLQIEWKILSYTDYLNLSQLRSYFVTFVTFRNKGYYGKLVMDGPESVPGSADTVHATGTFYATSPSDDGGADSINRIANPTGLATAKNGANTGGIPQNTTQHYFLTFSSEYGETQPVSSNIAIGANDNNSVSMTWSWASSAHLVCATIYNAADSSGTNPRLVAQIPASFAATWTDYVGYGGLTIPQNLPSVNQAYKGIWNAGIWLNQ